MTTVAPSIANFDPWSREYLIDPQVALQDLRREAPVFYHEPTGAYYVLRYADARYVLSESDTYSSRAYKTMPVRPDLRDRIPEEHERVGQVVQGGQLPNMDPPAHIVQRRAAQRTFTRKRIEEVKPTVAAIANELIDGFIGQGTCDLMRDFGVKLTLRVVATLLDVPRELLPGFHAWIDDVFGILAPIDLEPEDVTTPDDQLAATYERVYDAYCTYAEFVEQRRANPGTDLASAMLTLTNEDGTPVLSRDEVLAHMVGLTAAGTDTTANLIVNMVRLFTEFPDQLRLVLDDPRLWENAVCEGLRRSTIATQFFRISNRDSEIGGVFIPAGSKIGVCIPAANSDPEKFADPLRFDVRRSGAAEHLAFGRGRHFCLGATLAPQEARIALQTLYEKLPTLTADLDQELSFVPSLSVRGIISQGASW